MFQHPSALHRVNTRSQQQNHNQTKNSKTTAAINAAAGGGENGLAKDGAKTFGMDAASTAGAAANTRKRRALGDVSNTNALKNTTTTVLGGKAKDLKHVPGAQKTKIGKPSAAMVSNAKSADKPIAKSRPVRSAAAVAARKLSGSHAASIAAAIAKNDQHHQEAEAVVRKRQKTEEPVAEVEKKYWDDLDADDSNDPVMVSEYVVEIFEYLRELEKTTKADPHYMEHQKNLAWKMRSILIDWLVDVHLKFRLLPETLFLTVNLLDRFLSLRSVSMAKFQLVGITAMFIASKYEEVYAPSINQFVYIADGGFTFDEIIRAERYMLQVLDFNLQYPIPLNFLRRCSKADGYCIESRTIAKYLMELTLIDEEFIDFAPSLIAASAIYIARAMLGGYVKDGGVWTPNLRYYSGYKEEELKSCVQKMVGYLTGEKIGKYTAVRNKYSSKKYQNASIFVEHWLKKRSEDMPIPLLDDADQKDLSSTSLFVDDDEENVFAAENLLDRNDDEEEDDEEPEVDLDF